MFDAEQLFEGTRNLADKALTESREAYQQSLSLYTEVDSVVVPEVDVDSLVSESVDVKKKVKSFLRRRQITTVILELPISYFFGSCREESPQ